MPTPPRDLNEGLAAVPAVKPLQLSAPVTGTLFETTCGSKDTKITAHRSCHRSRNRFRQCTRLQARSPRRSLTAESARLWGRGWPAAWILVTNGEILWNWPSHSPVPRTICILPWR